MDILHIAFNIWCIVFVFVVLVLNILYFFGVDPVYSYFRFNHSAFAEWFGGIGIGYGLLNALSIIIELCFGGYTNTEGVHFWVFALIFNTLPVLVFGLYIFYKILAYCVWQLQWLHEDIIDKRKSK